MNAPRWNFALGDPHVKGGGLDIEPGGHVFNCEEHLNPSPGESDDTPGPPPSALASVRQRLLGWRRGRDSASGQPSCGLPGLPAATRTAPRLGAVPAPDCGERQGILVVIGLGPSVGLCPSEPHTAAEALAPYPSNSAPWPSAREESPTLSRRTRARLFRWPYRLMRR